MQKNIYLETIMNPVKKLLPLHIFACLLISFVNTSAILGQETQAQTLNNPCREPAVRISVGSSECGTCSVPKETTYLYGSGKVNFFQAITLCAQLGMELVSVNSREEELALENYTRTVDPKSGPYEGYWMSGTRHGALGTEFVWLTTGKPVFYRKFAANQPDNAGGKEACLEVFLNGPDDFAWNDIPCDTGLKVICQSTKQCL